VLEALIHRQDHDPAAAAELAMHEDAREVRLGAGIIALVAVEDALDLLANSHGRCSSGIRS
jgi:hypothetical protein